MGQNNQGSSWREDRYRAIFSVASNSEILRQIWYRAYGDDYPDETEPFGFVTYSDLKRIASLFGPPVERLLDIGCGKGGPGLWVARSIGAALLGIDILPEAIAQANVFLTRFANCPRAEFRVGSFTQTSLPANSVNAIVSIDCFWMVLDKVAALKEMARILSIPGRLVMTTWTQPHVDVSALMVDAGFQVSLFEETELWRERQLRVYADIRANAKALRAEIGDKAADVLLFEATTAPDSLQKNARILVCAEKG